MALRSTAGPGQGQAESTGRAVTIDADLARKAAAELLGTGLLVFFGAGVATVCFGTGFGASGSSIAAGMLTTGLVFGLVLAALVAFIGPISGCHVNPAVTLGKLLTRQMAIVDAVAYWVAQIIGGILGALLLLWVFSSSPFYHRRVTGLGANGYGQQSLLHTTSGGAFLAEVILTAVFVLVVLAATRKDASKAVLGGVIGLALALVNIMGIPIDGASVNPARSLGPAVVAGSPWIGQIWVFLIAPLVGAVLAAGVYLLFHPDAREAISGAIGAGRFGAQPAASHAAADEETRPVGSAAASTGTAPRPMASRPASPQAAPPSAPQSASGGPQSTSARPQPTSGPAGGPPPRPGTGSDPDADTGPVDPGRPSSS
jgi:aquaporin Z